MIPPETPALMALDLLVSVAELGSLGKAANRHGVSQPAVSMRMTQLERQLGISLLERSPTGTRLTPAGESVVGWCNQVLGATHTMMAAVTALRAHAGGHLRVAASLTVSDHLMPGWLVALRHDLPDVTVALEVTNSTNVVDLVRRGAADLGFVEGPVGDGRGLDTRRVGRDRLVVVVAPEHPWARRRRPLGGSELAAAELVVREPTSGTRQVLEGALAEWGGVRTHLELGSTAAILGAARRGEGPAVLSSLAVADDTAARRLVVVETEGVELGRSFVAVWLRSVSLPAPARHLLARAG
ncbi:MAG: LysR family transcriptional regulator [Actinomycetota bacterium]|nr:LysR family transcriptional regulator [Actinomycetota bacterium]